MCNVMCVDLCHVVQCYAAPHSYIHTRDRAFFLGNTAERGGGIYVGSVNSEFEFTRVVMEGNIANGYGGKMRMYEWK